MEPDAQDIDSSRAGCRQNIASVLWCHRMTKHKNEPKQSIYFDTNVIIGYFKKGDERKHSKGVIENAATMIKNPDITVKIPLISLGECMNWLFNSNNGGIADVSATSDIFRNSIAPLKQSLTNFYRLCILPSDCHCKFVVRQFTVQIRLHSFLPELHSGFNSSEIFRKRTLYYVSTILIFEFGKNIGLFDQFIGKPKVDPRKSGHHPYIVCTRYKLFREGAHNASAFPDREPPAARPTRDGGAFNASETPIQAAVGAAGDGDAIFVHGGLWRECECG